MSPKLQKKRTYCFHAIYGDLKVVDGIKNKEYLLSLTLRQLRQEASKLSVPLYSRKTKAVLIDLIDKYQQNASEEYKKPHLKILLQKSLIFLLNHSKKKLIQN